MRARAATLASVLVAAALVLAACGQDDNGNVDSDQVDAVEPPQQGACRVLTPEDVALPSNATKVVDCSTRHTAETFAVGDLPPVAADAAYDAEELGAFAYQTCSTKFREFLGADESTVLRTVVSWAWFRPSEKAWEKGARWYRCDVIGGGEESKAYAALPPTAAGLLAQQPTNDEWMVCANGPSVQGAPKIPCTEKHNWRAVTTIKVGDPEDPYPGDRVVEVTTRDYCSRSVGAWLGYPPAYDFGYTWFHEGEWKAGNRRSVCWAATTA
ncbi:septum formation family protein [Nocardioides halotolerans]|uniref:septum formation family protein n=1 Tax=Nocardioides halotolerans TaxID=433660 RepID=UPI000418D246|nr:septum formation family protein [Nocardioides halotolerans]